ncbi:MAG: rhomboid family intramembrane serine protease [Acidobacteriota bacterium]
MLKRQRTGSVVCPGCGKLVGVNEEQCYFCGRRNPSLWGFAPLLRRWGHNLGFVDLVTWGCIGLYIATLLADPSGVRMGGILSMLSPSMKGLFLFGASGAAPVFAYGRWWTVLSAAWLHGGLLHILFNMMWVRQLVPATEALYGTGRMIIIYTVASITGFGMSAWAGAFLPGFLGGAAFTIGASAPIFGLLGALVFSGRRGARTALSQQAMGYAVILFIFGFLMPGIDNWAHFGGFAGGYAAAKWLDPLLAERVDHLIAGLVCIGLTVLSIVASVFHGLGYV